MAVLGCLIVLWMQFGAPADNSLAPTDAGTRLINQHFPRQWGDTLTLAIRSAQPVTSPAVRERVTSALTPFGRAEHVTAVGSPYQAPGRTSANRHIAFATVQFGVKASKIPAGEAKALMNDARAASGGGLSFYLGGDVVDMAETPEGGPSEGIGVTAAAIVLLISDHTSQTRTGPGMPGRQASSSPWLPWLTVASNQLPVGSNASPAQVRGGSSRPGTMSSRLVRRCRTATSNGGPGAAAAKRGSGLARASWKAASVPSRLNTGLARSTETGTRPAGNSAGAAGRPVFRSMLSRVHMPWAGGPAQPCRLTSRTWPAAASGWVVGRHHQPGRGVGDRGDVRFERERAAPGRRSEHRMVCPVGHGPRTV